MILVILQDKIQVLHEIYFEDDLLQGGLGIVILGVIFLFIILLNDIEVVAQVVHGVLRDADMVVVLLHLVPLQKLLQWSHHDQNEHHEGQK